MMPIAHALGSALLTPPGMGLVSLILGIALAARGSKLGRALLLAGTTLLLVSSLPVVADSLMQGLETSPALEAPVKGPGGPQAIVVLAGGRYRHAPEYGGTDVVSGSTLLRLRYAAYLYRETRLPVLTSGGTVFGHGAPGALLMRHSLRADFGVPVQWVDTHSRNTLQNARDSAQILRKAHISRIYLVTQAWHMQRALRVFRETGLVVVPAPTAFVTDQTHSARWLGWLPSAQALRDTARVFHEYLGMLWYRLGGG